MLITKYYINDDFYCGSITYAHKTQKKSHKQFKKVHNISFGSKQQAFARASRLLFFNPDLCHFSTLTFKKKCFSYPYAYKCFKNFLQKERILNSNFKYIAVCEEHKDHSLHFHLISNKITKNAKGSSRIVRNWCYGFSSSWTTSQMTYFHRKHSLNVKRFEPLKYLFNYIKKTNNKIGGRWLLKSANLIKPKKLSVEATVSECISYRVHRTMEGAIFEKKFINVYSDIQQLYIYNYFKKPILSRSDKIAKRSGEVATSPDLKALVKLQSEDFCAIFNRYKFYFKNNEKNRKQCLSSNYKWKIKKDWERLQNGQGNLR